MTAYELKNTAIINVKGANFRGISISILWSFSRDEAINRLHNSVLKDKSVL